MTSDGTAVQRVLEGVLLRLARRPDAAEFVLRGGMLLRHWFAPRPRAVEDVDLVATFPFDVEAAARRFLPVLADEAIDDGVRFAHARAEGMFLDTGTPGLRVFAAGLVGGVEVDVHVDITAGPYPRPAPVCQSIPTASGATARVWACRPEAVAAQKVQALIHLGLHGWRPKDLNDLRLLLERVPMDAADLREAVRGYLADLGRTGADARRLFGPGAWWGLKFSSARWLDFVARAKGQDVPTDLAGVAAGIAARLDPVLGGMP